MESLQQGVVLGALVTAQGWLSHTPGWAASPPPLPKQTCKNRACRSD